MNNNSNKATLLTIMSVLSVMVLSGCYKRYSPTVLPEPQPGKVYLEQATDSLVQVTLTNLQKIATVHYNANIGGAGAAKGNVGVSFSVDPSLVSRYNSEHATSYTLLPDGNYTLSAKDTMIAAGQKHGPVLELTIQNTSASFLKKDTPYLLPITVKVDSGGLSVNKDLQNAFILVTSFITPPGQKPAGQGTTADPYLVASLSNLKWIAGHASSWTAAFKQTQDIDASETSDWNNNKGFIGIGRTDTTFTGTYDGQGHTITGLYINRINTTDVGLFNSTGAGAVLENLTLAQVNITGGDDAAPLVGINYGNVTGVSVISGQMTGGSGDNIGGVIGSNHGALIKNCEADINVNGKGKHIGGLIGYSKGNATIEDSHATGDVKSDGEEVGGLIGDNYDQVSNCSATGDVTAGDVYAGGLVGINYGPITNSYATGAVDGPGDNGGLVGDSHALISHCYSTGDVTAPEHSNGGLVGYCAAGGSIEYSYATGNVTSKNASTGGLVGYSAGKDVVIQYCFSTGNAVATTGGYVGGLVADIHYGKIINCYSTGDAVTGSSSAAGGLVGQFLESGVTIKYCYSTGKASNGTKNAGGLLGNNGGTVTDSYWDKLASGLTSSTGGTGLTTQQMQGPAAKTNMTGFDFTKVWQVQPDGYPILIGNHL